MPGPYQAGGLVFEAADALLKKSAASVEELVKVMKAKA
jgi:hypothetical protein